MFGEERKKEERKFYLSTTQHMIIRKTKDTEI